MYSNQDVAAIKNISVQREGVSVQEILDIVLKGHNLTYLIEDKIIFIKKQSQTSVTKIRGRVTDTKSEPLAGVTILIEGTCIGTTTDSNGNYVFTIPDIDKINIIYSFIGMAPYKVAYTGQENINVILKESAETMDEVVVTGYQTLRKSDVVGSVSTVKASDIMMPVYTSVDQMLQGRVAGMMVMNTSSRVGTSPKIRIRGTSTILGNQDPLWVVDGVIQPDPIPLNQNDLMVDDLKNILGNQISWLNPADIETVTVLKDASATAIYGSKAANGVIVIETKAPLPGDLRITYAGNIRLELPDLSGYDLLNAEEKLRVEKMAGYYPEDSDYSYVQIYQQYLREVRRGVNTDWLDIPLRNAVQHRHAVTLEGGDRALRYKLYVGGNFTPGVMKESTRKTQTAALDLSYRFNKLLIRNNITLDNATGDNSPWGSFSEYTRLNPYLRPYGENGEIKKNLQVWQDPKEYWNTDPIPNPMYNTTFNSKDRNSSFTVRDQFYLEYNPISSVRLQADVAIAKSNGKTEIFRPAQHTKFISEADPMRRGEFIRQQDESFNYNINISASYNDVIAADHFVSFNARYSIDQTSNDWYGATVTGFPNDQMDNILFGKKYNEKMTGSENTSRSIGFVGAFGYSFRYKYSVDFNIRADGSSQFGKHNRFAPFWSAGVRWDIKKENSVKKVSWISDLIARASYGITGTQGFAPYQAQQVYTYSMLKPYISSDGTGAELVALGNSNLKWQQTGQLNVALEAGFLNNRITAKVEYYQKRTKNSLTDITLAPSLGFSSIPENLGTIENKGVEFAASFIPYKDASREAYWIINFNGSHNRDKMTKISNALEYMNSVNAGKLDATPLPRYEEGQSLNNIWVVKSLGIDPATGQEVFQKRITGELTGVWDAVDVIPYGNTEPKLQGNIYSTFNYKGFGVSVGFNYRFGGQVYNNTLVSKVENADLRYNADRRVLDLRWQKPGDVVKYKALTNAVKGSETKATSRFVMDDNTFQFSSIALSYRFPASHPFLKKMKMSALSMSLNMEDVAYISSVKRERGLDYPFARQFSFSLNVAF
jgi:TonB-linked SusC/RagA family outer membrane protein